MTSTTLLPLCCSGHVYLFSECKKISHPRCSQKGYTKALQLMFSTTRTVYLHQMPETCGKAKNHHPLSSHFSGKPSLAPGRRACSKWRHQEALRSLGIARTIHGLGWTIEHARFTQMQSEMDNTGIETTPDFHHLKSTRGFGSMLVRGISNLVVPQEIPHYSHQDPIVWP